MLQQVLIIKDDKIIYQRTYSKAVSKEEFQILFMKLKKETTSDFSRNEGNYISFDNRLTYIFERNLGLYFIFLSGLVDEVKDLELELKKLKDEFLNLFGEVLDRIIESSLLEVLNPTVDAIHANLRPKISLVGFSGVGKTTTTKLIREEEIPIEHVPTITGARSIIKIGKLQFVLWDFAGQEQFSYLWNNFIKGSDACLLITDSSLENVEKSKFFIELIREEAPYANSAVIANKQDLPGALKTEEVERILGLKTYAMIAIDPKNRDKMIRVISDILDISSEVSPLLKPIYERDLLILDAQRAFEKGDYTNAITYFEKISDLCLDIGDDSLGKEFYEKAQNLRKKLREEAAPITQVPKVSEKPEPSTITESTPYEAQVPEGSEKTEPPTITESAPYEAQIPESFEKPEPPTITEPAPYEAQIPESFEKPEPPTITEPAPHEAQVPESFEKPELPTITEPAPHEAQIPESFEKPELPTITEPAPHEAQIPESFEKPEPPTITESTPYEAQIPESFEKPEPPTITEPAPHEAQVPESFEKPELPTITEPAHHEAQIPESFEKPEPPTITEPAPHEAQIPESFEKPEPPTITESTPYEAQIPESFEKPEPPTIIKNGPYEAQIPEVSEKPAILAPPMKIRATTTLEQIDSIEIPESLQTPDDEETQNGKKARKRKKKKDKLRKKHKKKRDSLEE